MRNVTSNARLGRAPFVAAFRVAFEHRLDPMLGKMMLQQRGVEVAAAVLVADGEDGGRGLRAGGWRRRVSAMGEFTLSITSRSSPTVTCDSAAPFDAVVFHQLVELGGKHQSRSNGKRPHAGRFTRAAKRTASRDKLVGRGVDRQRAIETVGPAQVAMMAVADRPRRIARFPTSRLTTLVAPSKTRARRARTAAARHPDDTALWNRQWRSAVRWPIWRRCCAVGDRDQLNFGIADCGLTSASSARVAALLSTRWQSAIRISEFRNSSEP